MYEEEEQGKTRKCNKDDSRRVEGNLLEQ